MAHSLSAKKRIRQNTVRRARNRARRGALKTKYRKCLETFGTGDLQASEQAFRAVCRLLDREASRRTLHPNAAARRKHLLAIRLNALKKQPATN